MIGRTFCRLGWHSWKPHMKRLPYVTLMPVYAFFLPERWVKVEKICRHCRKRVSV